MSIKEKEKSSNIDFEKISLEIISSAGKAKFLAIEAITLAKEAQFETALKMIDEANDNITKALQSHMSVIVEEGKGYQLPFSVLFMHSEDHLLTTQMMIEISKEFINLYQFINRKK
ncbi:PTS lactose/cellobiose transporter subunit IIA [Spiroplasma endosymbiont of Lasioglossum villosulum]|uniref:PTS lactose/cellobiose transporter subunit IIA n=1 Tax=Spiroplasma endosymbiont of Lasioglossum villosulum TaxID=3066320 RepID=UPI0030D47A05